MKVFREKGRGLEQCLEQNKNVWSKTKVIGGKASCLERKRTVWNNYKKSACL